MPDYMSLVQDIRGRYGQLVADVEELASINTGSTNLAGLNEFEHRLLDIFGPLADSVTVEPLEPWLVVDDQGHPAEVPLGRAVRVRCRPNAPRQMLLVGHYDTVFDADHPFQQVKVERERILGPGVADMKGGLVVLRAALEVLESSDYARHVGWEAVFNPDEELGSVGSASILADAARGKDVGFVFEPSFPDGGLAGARKGSGTFTVVVRGRAAHAGREHAEGRNAVAALARLTSDIDALNRRWDDVTVNVGVVRGGEKTNVVPAVAVLWLNVRADTNATAEAVVEAIGDLCRRASVDGITARVSGGFTRPPKPLDDRQRTLLDAAVAAAADIGLELTVRPTGGVSDGNNLYAAGVPNIDNLGVHGANIHSPGEFLWIESLVTRSQLAALLFLRFATGNLTL